MSAQPDLPVGKPLDHLGTCTLCSSEVYRPKGDEDAAEVLRKPMRLHRHKKPYSIYVPRTDDGEYRYWHDQAPWFVR